MQASIKHRQLMGLLSDRSHEQKILWISREANLSRNEVVQISLSMDAYSTESTFLLAQQGRSAEKFHAA